MGLIQWISRANRLATRVYQCQPFKKSNPCYPWTIHQISLLIIKKDPNERISLWISLHYLYLNSFHNCLNNNFKLSFPAIKPFLQHWVHLLLSNGHITYIDFSQNYILLHRPTSSVLTCCVSIFIPMPLP